MNSLARGETLISNRSIFSAFFNAFVMSCLRLRVSPSSKRIMALRYFSTACSPIHKNCSHSCCRCNSLAAI